MVERIELHKEELEKLFDSYLNEMIKEEMTDERRADLKEKWDKAVNMTVEDLKKQEAVDMEMYRMVQFIHGQENGPLPPAGEAALQVPEEKPIQKEEAA